MYAEHLHRLCSNLVVCVTKHVRDALSGNIIDWFAELRSPLEALFHIRVRREACCRDDTYDPSTGKFVPGKKHRPPCIRPWTLDVTVALLSRGLIGVCALVCAWTSGCYLT